MCTQALLLLLQACDGAAVRCVCIPGRTDPGCYAVAHLSQPTRPLPGITLVDVWLQTRTPYCLFCGGPRFEPYVLFDVQYVDRGMNKVCLCAWQLGQNALC